MKFTKFFLTLVISLNFAYANTQDILNTEKKSAQTAIASQKHAEILDEQGQAFFEEFRMLRHETLQIEAYNTRLTKWNAGLKQEITKLKADIKNLEATRRSLIPLLEDMVQHLQLLIQNDLPFNLEQRLASVADLNKLLDATNVSQAEKLRKILQTYRQELEYGKTIDSYKQELQVAGSKQMVTILRLGRIGLYYLTANDEAGFFNSHTQKWEEISSSAGKEVKKAIEMAEKSGIPQLLHLPLSVSEEKP